MEFFLKPSEWKKNYSAILKTLLQTTYMNKYQKKSLNPKQY